VIPVGALVLAVAANSVLFINYVHVFFAILWTGTDVFIAFILGPIMSRVSPSSRRELTSWIVPRTLFYLPTLMAVTIIAGYFMGASLGYLTLAPPVGYYMVGVIIVVVILVAQGLGILLPANFQVYLELQKSEPDYAKIQKLMSRFAKVVTSQSIVQIITIFIMANLATGLPPIF